MFTYQCQCQHICCVTTNYLGPVFANARMCWPKDITVNGSSMSLSTWPWANSLWVIDAIWRRITGSTMVQVMACAGRYPAITLANVNLLSVKSSDIQLRAIYPQPSITSELTWTFIQISQGPFRFRLSFLNNAKILVINMSKRIDSLLKLEQTFKWIKLHSQHVD